MTRSHASANFIDEIMVLMLPPTSLILNPPQSVTNFQHFQTGSHTNILQMMTDQVVMTTKKNFRKKFGVVKRSDGCENNLVVIWEK
jgi:hypothetical protein